MILPARARLAWAALALLAAGLAPSPEAVAQRDSRDAERRLERVRKELDEVARERRRLEGERGEAATRLRSADERLARSARTLRETEAELERQQAALAELAGRRDALQARVDAQRGELHALLRSAYATGSAAPLKLLLAQDQVAEAGRALTYHRYLQRQRAERIDALGKELSELDALERGIAERQAALEQTRARQREQLQALEGDRRTHAQAVSQLDRRYRDRSSR
ncbi:peptidase M23, partial [Luteimonas composti]|nr:peptidase M23 [Luteimonas composti]